MVSYEFPYIVEIFLTSLGIIGTLLVAYAIIEQAKGDNNSGRVLLVIFGIFPGYIVVLKIVKLSNVLNSRKD